MNIIVESQIKRKLCATSYHDFTRSERTPILNKSINHEFAAMTTTTNKTVQAFTLGTEVYLVSRCGVALFLSASSKVCYAILGIKPVTKLVSSKFTHT
jgi:hypothetical protein